LELDYEYYGIELSLPNNKWWGVRNPYYTLKAVKEAAKEIRQDHPSNEYRIVGHKVEVIQEQEEKKEKEEKNIE